MYLGGGSSDAVVRGGVRIPRSSPRSCQTSYAKILRRVDADAGNAMGFEGDFVRPGAVVTDAQLWPDEQAPRIPIVLECASVPGQGHKTGHNRRDWLYILWRYSPERYEWTEIGRAISMCWDWAVVLRPLAVRALRESLPRVEISVNFVEIDRRIAAMIDAELSGLEIVHQHQVLGILHHHLACRAANMACFRMPPASEKTLVARTGSVGVSSPLVTPG